MINNDIFAGDWQCNGFEAWDYDLIRELRDGGCLATYYTEEDGYSWTRCDVTETAVADGHADSLAQAKKAAEESAARAAEKAKR